MWHRCLVVALLLLAGAASAAELPIVGILAMGTDPTAKLPRWERFYSRLRELGGRDGENLRLEPRFAAGDAAKMDTILRDFVHARVAVVVVTGAGEALAAKHATATIPIVMLQVLDPVELGLVHSLARPGGNITGRTQKIGRASCRERV